MGNVEETTDSEGCREWFLDGERHRVDGPAIEMECGSTTWYLDGELHREDGPAIDWVDDTKFWYLNGKEFTQEEFEARNKPSSGHKD